MKKNVMLIIAIIAIVFISAFSVIITREIDRQAVVISLQDDSESDPHRFKAYPVDTLYVNGWRNSFSISPVIIDDNIYIPLKELGVMLNYTVSFDEITREIKIDSIPQKIQYIFMPYDTDFFGLHLGMKIEEMTTMLGDPLRKEARFESVFEEDVWYFYYNFGYVRFEPNDLINEYCLTNITIDNDQFFVSRQIKVGMGYESVLERYFVTMYEEEKWQREEITQYLYQISDSTYGVIDFDEIKNVRNIRFYFDNSDFDIYYSQFLNCYLRFDVFNNKINSIHIGWATSRN